MKEIENHNTLVFIVSRKANKPQVRYGHGTASHGVGPCVFAWRSFFLLLLPAHVFFSGPPRSSWP